RRLGRIAVQARGCGQGFEPSDSGTRWRARPARLSVLRRSRGGGPLPVLWGDLMRFDTNRTPLGVAVLGSTGSIGRSTLEVLRRQRDHFRVVALTGGRREEQLAEQVAEWRPAFAGLAAGNGGSRLPTGPAVLVEAATLPEVDIVVNAVVG